MVLQQSGLKMICNRCKKNKDSFINGSSKCDECYDYTQKYYKAHREQAKERALKYQQENREKVNKQKKQRRLDNPVGYMLMRVKTTAKKKNLPFNLTKADITIPKVCPILGIPLIIAYNNKGPSDYSPSLDRIDSTKGYVKGNIQVISHRANTIKNNATIEELFLIANYLNDLNKKLSP